MGIDNSRPTGRRSLLTVLACVALLMLGPIPRAAAQPTRLTISYAQKTFDFLPLLVAQDAGYFKKHGLDVTVRYLPAEEGIPALISRQVEGVAIGASDAASAEAQGAKLKLVFTLSPVYPFQFWVWPKYASASKLKGQRVAISSTTGSGYAGTLLALKELGLKPTDVSLTPMGAISNQDNALLAGTVAAVSSHPPTAYKFKQAGLVDLVDLAKKQMPSVNAGVWFTSSYIKAHPVIVQSVVDAVLQALNREKADRAFTESELTKYLKVKNKDELDFTYNFYTREVLTSGPLPQANGVQSNIDALAAGNPKVKTLKAAAMIDQSFVKNAQKLGTTK
jgi:NitT/TauT family transport system substrate-binding protein